MFPMCVDLVQSKKQTLTYTSFVTISMQKLQGTDYLLPEILVIKESCNLTGQEHILKSFKSSFNIWGKKNLFP